MIGMAKSTSYLLKTTDWKIQVQVVREWRTGIRFSIGKKGAYLRFPRHLGASQVTKEIERANLWIREQLSGNPNLAAHFYKKEYHHGQTLVVGDHNYVLLFAESNAKSWMAQLVDDHRIVLRIPQKSTPEQIAQQTPALLSRVIGRHHLPRITARVEQLNQLHFQQPLGSVKLKHNKSNWGSCSHNGNINLSTRLLFAPAQVQDYVIIHELSHLIEMNHSKAFYTLVKSAMPDYQVKEKWLKDHSHLCHF